MALQTVKHDIARDLVRRDRRSCMDDQPDRLEVLRLDDGTRLGTGKLVYLGAGDRRPLRNLRVSAPFNCTPLRIGRERVCELG